MALAIFLSLMACNGGHVSEIYRGLQKAEEFISDDKKEDALIQLFELENSIDATTPDTLKYKVLSRIGGIYYSDLKEDKADEYFKKALAVARKCGNGYLSVALWNRCLTLSDNDSILIYLKECHDISHASGTRYTEAMSGINLANAYIQIGNMDKAHEVLDNMDHVVGNDSVLEIELTNARLNYLIINKSFDKAKEILKAQDVRNLNLYGRFSRYRNLYAIEIGNGRYDKAIEYRDSIDEIKSEIDSISFDEKLSKTELEFASKLDKEKKDRDIAIIISLCVIILLSAFLFAGIKRRLIMRKQIELNEQILKLNLRIAQLTESHNEGDTPVNYVGADIQPEVIEKLRLNKEMFISKPIYGRLKQLNLKRDSDAIDKKAVNEILECVIGQFADVCSTIRQLYPGMTSDDVLYCSIIYVGFSKEVASVAFGSSEDALRRRKSRIKQKLPPAIFDAIFGTKA
ncbi:MAG: hypothetical protein J6C78_05645 [Muribaculaceae bacterium]|nr:hypothetical protein [Muribaculaceae bacterium]